MSGEIIVAAPAKLNLFLHVGGKRPDGFHDLESLVAFTRCGDEIRLEPDDAISLSVEGSFAAAVSGGEDNLVSRAARALAEKAGFPYGARIRLQKNLPVASGVGGGSADAAAVLRGLARLWKFDLDREHLRTIGASLGSDIPVCIDSLTAWMEGSGERVCVLPPLPQAGILLVNPGVPVATGDVFAALRECRGLGMQPPETPFVDIQALVEFLRQTTNDLESPAREIAPAIGNVLSEINDLPDIRLARMSGSGATCFGLFANEDAARVAGETLRTRHPAWWIAETTFVDASQ